MKSANKHIKVFVISLLLIAISGCSNHYDVTEKLQQAESLMDSQPDSALLVLQSIDGLDEQDMPKYLICFIRRLLTKITLNLPMKRILQPPLNTFFCITTIEMQ
jgi:hypothetical protein